MTKAPPDKSFTEQSTIEGDSDERHDKLADAPPLDDIQSSVAQAPAMKDFKLDVPPTKNQSHTLSGNSQSGPASIGQETDDREDGNLIDQLIAILEAHDKEGSARVGLFASRIAFRLFGLAIDRISVEQRKPESHYGAEEVVALWHNLLICWRQTEKYEFTELPESLVSSESAFRIGMQLREVRYGESTDEIARAAARCFGSATKRLMQITRNAALLNVVESDIKLLVSDESLDNIRVVPLWPDNSQPGELETLDWFAGLKRLGDAVTDVRLKKALSEIARDYQIMLLANFDTKSIQQIAIDKQESDKPSATDHLGRDELINALLPRLSVPDDEGHLTIGLLGDWGIGKSSVIRLLTESLKSVPHCDYVVANFNAWSYENTPNIQAGIAHEIIGALSSQNQWPAGFKWLYKPLVVGRFAIRLHGKRILWILCLILLSVLGLSLVNLESYFGQGVTGVGLIFAAGLIWKELRTVSAQPLAKELNTYLRLPSYHEHLGTIPAMENNLKTLCNICLGKTGNKGNRRLMFFVDDLDRCGVDGIVKTFEAIRLVLEIPWVTVVIAVDQRIALPALACHYEKLSKYHMHDPMSIARDYLAKLIHLPISLPAPDDLAVAQYLGHLWQDDSFAKQISENYTINLGRSDQADVSTTPVSGASDNNDLSEPLVTGWDLDTVLKDIGEYNIPSVYTSQSKDKPAVEQTAGFSQAHKACFYEWLCRFNLRNPRQIKRLYNGYNLLWAHIGTDKWSSRGEDRFPAMLALLALEMINENVLNRPGQDLRKAYRLKFFNSTIESSELEITGIELRYIQSCRMIILEYQKESGTDLLNRIEPFVLPAIGMNVDMSFDS